MQRRVFTGAAAAAALADHQHVADNGVLAMVIASRRCNPCRAGCRGKRDH